MLGHRRHTSGQKYAETCRLGATFDAAIFPTHTSVECFRKATTALRSALRAAAALTGPGSAGHTVRSRRTGHSLLPDRRRLVAATSGEYPRPQRDETTLDKTSGVCVQTTTAHALRRERSGVSCSGHNADEGGARGNAARVYIATRREPREGLAEPLASALAPLGPSRGSTHHADGDAGARLLTARAKSRGTTDDRFSSSS